jgi:hypothetical protein
MLKCKKSISFLDEHSYILLMNDEVLKPSLLMTALKPTFDTFVFGPYEVLNRIDSLCS